MTEIDTPAVAAPPDLFNFAQHLLGVNAARANKAAFIDDAGTLSYGELADRVKRLAAGLRALGLKREERVLLLMQDGNDWPVSFLGAMYAGVVPVAVNTLLTADDYAYMLEHSRAQAVLVSGALLPVLNSALVWSRLWMAVDATSTEITPRIATVDRVNTLIRADRVQRELVGRRIRYLDFTRHLDLATASPHRLTVGRSRINRKSHGDAAQPQRVPDAARHRGQRIFLVVQYVMVVQLEDQRNLAGKVAGAGLQKSQRRGIGITSGVDAELEMIVGVIPGRVRREAAGRPMLESLIDRQNHELAGPG